jgi:hypothetical protein
MEPKRSSSSGGGGKQAEYYAEKLSDPSLGKNTDSLEKLKTVN